MPCFNWKNPGGRHAVLADGQQCGKRRVAFSARAPSNGTLAAVFTCAGRFGEAIGGARRGKARGAGGGGGGAWGLLVLGDSPGFISLAQGLPQLHGRVVDTNDGGKPPRSLRALPARAAGGVCPLHARPPSSFDLRPHRRPPAPHCPPPLRPLGPCRQPGAHGLRHLVHLGHAQVFRAHRRPRRRLDAEHARPLPRRRRRRIRLRPLLVLCRRRHGPLANLLQGARRAAAPPRRRAAAPPRRRAARRLQPRPPPAPPSQERHHFGAMYSQKFSHRDIPMRNEQVLQVLMQTTEFKTGYDEWGTA